MPLPLPLPLPLAVTACCSAESLGSTALGSALALALGAAAAMATSLFPAQAMWRLPCGVATSLLTPLLPGLASPPAAPPTLATLPGPGVVASVLAVRLDGALVGGGISGGARSVASSSFMEGMPKTAPEPWKRWIRTKNCTKTYDTGEDPKEHILGYTLGNTKEPHENNNGKERKMARERNAEEKEHRKEAESLGTLRNR